MFGEAGALRWTVQGAYIISLGTTDDRSVNMGLVGGGFTYFFVTNLSLNLELNGFVVDQPGTSNAWGINFNLLARWHFLARDRWSIYGDGGVGVMYTTEPVPGPDAGDPRGGGQFSFTPQIGFGASFEVADSTRLLVGARLHHISNAQSASNNPPRNSLYFYIAASFPF